MGARSKAYLVLFVVFVLGIAVGGGVFYAYAERRHAGLLEDDRRGALDHWRLRALSRRLGLDRNQEDKIADIVTRHRQEGQALAEEMFERCGEPLRRHRADLDDQIRGVLKPEQQQGYTDLMQRRHNRFLLGPGLPPPPPP